MYDSDTMTMIIFDDEDEETKKMITRMINRREEVGEKGEERERILSSIDQLIFSVRVGVRSASERMRASE